MSLPAPTPPGLAQWAARAVETVEAARSAADRIRALFPVPADGTPDDRLRALARVWRDLKLPWPNNHLDPSLRRVSAILARTQRRNQQARRSHYKSRRRRLHALGLFTSHMRSCIPP